MTINLEQNLFDKDSPILVKESYLSVTRLVMAGGIKIAQRGQKICVRLDQGMSECT